MALNGGPEFKFTEAISLFVNCATQAEVDDLWEKLSAGGEEQQCGWLKDKYGLSWQIIPQALMDLLQDKDAAESAAGHGGHAQDGQDRHCRLETSVRTRIIRDTENRLGYLDRSHERKITVITEMSTAQLRATLNGQMIAPDDAEYDKARTVFYGGIDRRPAVIVRVADATDVARVVSLARETGLELAVRSGGHSVAGHSVSDGGIVLDLSAMRALDIDVEQRTAWVETGLTAAEYTATAERPWPRDRVRRHRLGRDRRDHAGWRCWISRPQIRPHDRLSAGRRGCDRRWPAAPCRCRESS